MLVPWEVNSSLLFLGSLSTVPACAYKGYSGDTKGLSPAVLQGLLGGGGCAITLKARGLRIPGEVCDILNVPE